MPVEPAHRLPRPLAGVQPLLVDPFGARVLDRRRVRLDRGVLRLVEDPRVLAVHPGDDRPLVPVPDLPADVPEGPALVVADLGGPRRIEPSVAPGDGDRAPIPLGRELIGDARAL